MNNLDPRHQHRITTAEMARRREHVRRADAENRLEGLTRNPATDPMFEAYIRGEIEAIEIVQSLKAQPQKTDRFP
jgi:Antitoxin VbhA